MSEEDDIVLDRTFIEDLFLLTQSLETRERDIVYDTLRSTRFVEGRRRDVLPLDGVADYAQPLTAVDQWSAIADVLRHIRRYPSLAVTTEQIAELERLIDIAENEADRNRANTTTRLTTEDQRRRPIIMFFAAVVAILILALLGMIIATVRD